jgi:hypothetical protein
MKITKIEKGVSFYRIYEEYIDDKGESKERKWGGIDKKLFEGLLEYLDRKPECKDSKSVN